jgi:hypothetical protein
MLRRIFGPKREEVTGECRRLHNYDLYALYYSPNTIRVITSRTMRLAERVECMIQGKGVYRVLVGQPEERRPLARHKLDGRIILKCTFQK